jgi:tRNA-dihydrouridine synthase
MVRNKGRGSGILKTPDVLRRMLEAGCEEMGEGRFSVKARLGVDSCDELLRLMPMINVFPLRFLTVHGRIARQMYEGECDRVAVGRIAAECKVPLILNGDLDWRAGEGMVGRSFIRFLGEKEGSAAGLARYIDMSLEELKSPRPVIGRINSAPEKATGRIIMMMTGIRKDSNCAASTKYTKPSATTRASSRSLKLSIISV